MSENTTIEWATHTFNPWWGCMKVSPGCDNCYAERDAGRFAAGQVLWGADSVRRIFGQKHWDEPLKWNAKAARAGKRCRVFTASMGDVFDNAAPEELRARLFALIRETPHLDWLVLTKRIGNVARMLPADWGAGYDNVSLGISVVNQHEVNRDVPKLLHTPARTRWLSMEPLLGPVKLTEVEIDQMLTISTPGLINALCTDDEDRYFQAPNVLDWVIVGGESGPQARPMNPEWVQALHMQCREFDVPFLFKQWGEWVPVPEGTTGAMRVHRFDNGTVMARVGRKMAGRRLDGVEHDGYPEHLLEAV